MRRLGAVGIALIGLWTAVMAVQTVTSTVSFSLVQDSNGPFYIVTVFVLPAVLLFIAGVFLVIFRDRIAARWFDEAPADVAMDPEAALRLGLLITGLVFTVLAVRLLLVSFTQPLVIAASDKAMFDTPYSAPTKWADVLPTIIASAVQILIGVALVVFSRSFACAMWKLGSPKPGPAAPSPRPLAACASCGAEYDPSDYGDVTTSRCSSCHGPLVADGD